MKMFIFFLLITLSLLKLYDNDLKMFTDNDIKRKNVRPINFIKVHISNVDDAGGLFTKISSNLYIYPQQGSRFYQKYLEL